MHIDIYTGSDQKTLRPIVNLLNKEINSIIIITRLQTDYKRVRIRKHISWTIIRDEQNLPLSHTEDDQLSQQQHNTQSSKNLLRKSYRSLTLGFSKLFLRISQSNILQSQHKNSKS